MKWGVLAVLAFACGPAWAQVQSPAGNAPVNAPARSEQTDRMQFSWVREAGDCRDRCRSWIAASGRLTDTSVADFEAFRQGRDVRGATVVLESSGGLVDAGLTLGRAFRRLELATMVGHTTMLPPDANGERRATLSPRATCASMCVFAFLGGVRRHVPADARVLVHQIWPSKLREDALAGTYSAGHMVRIQRELGQIGRYTVEMGADIELFELAMRIPPWESLRPLTRDELRRLRVHTAEVPFVTAAVGPGEQGAAPAQRVALASPTLEPPRGWSLTRQDGRSLVTRRHPLTVEGREIGSFELSFACGEAADAYQVLYSEKRLAEAGAAADRINGVRMVIQREPVLLKIEASAPVSTDLVTTARGALSAPLARTLTESDARSLLVETISAGKQRTAIRVGPAGLADSFREMAASCPK